MVGGLVRVYMGSPDGRQVTVRYARRSDVLGIAVLVGGPADVGVQTLASTTVFGIDAAVLADAARRDGRVGWVLAEELNRRLYQNLQQTAVNAFGTVRQRVALHVLDLASEQQGPSGPLIARVTQQELAEAVGSVREVVARVLRDLRAAGLVATTLTAPGARPDGAARPDLEPDDAVIGRHVRPLLKSQTPGARERTLAA